MTSICPVCSNQFDASSGRGRRKTYCTPECRNAQHRTRAATRTPVAATCSVEGCDSPCRSAGSRYCEKHYMRLRRTGNTASAYREATGSCLFCATPTPGVYCTPLCQDRDRRPRRAPQREACAVCASPIPSSRRWDATTCSTVCNREKHRLARYGLSPQAYQAMLLGQGGGCAICGESEKLVIDHNHQPGEVRGVLCSGCNTGIGMLGDSVSRLTAAASYLASR